MKKIYVAHYCYDAAGDYPQSGVIAAGADRDKVQAAADKFEAEFSNEYTLTVDPDTGIYYDVDDNEVTFDVTVEEISVVD